MNIFRFSASDGKQNMHESMDKWIDRFGNVPIPVMPHTISQLAKQCKDDVSIHELVELIETDPGLTVQLIRTSSASLHGRLRSEVTSVQQALMMMGIENLKKLPSTLPNIDKTLKGSAKQHLLKTFSIAYHAARQATDWAKLRRDMVPDEVAAASLLHFIGEMMMSIHAPEQLDKIKQMRDEEHIASEEAQYIVLGFSLDQLSLEIAERWNLPALVKEVLHAENARHPRAYTIMLAVQLARHAAWDWYTPRMNKLYEEAAEWLDKPMSSLIKDTHKLAVRVARDSEFYNIIPSAALLLADHKEGFAPTENVKETDQPEQHAGICLIPQMTIMKEVINQLKTFPAKEVDLHKLIELALYGLHDGIGLNRVVFAVYDKPKNMLKAYSIVGADNDTSFGQFQISLDQKNLFSYMATKIQAIWLNDSNREQYGHLIPASLQKVITTDNFFSMSVILNNSLYGLFYADRHTTDCHLDNRSYSYFKAICMEVIRTMQRIPGLHR